MFLSEIRVLPTHRTKGEPQNEIDRCQKEHDTRRHSSVTSSSKEAVSFLGEMEIVSEVLEHHVDEERIIRRPKPLVLEPITGVPPEYCEFLDEKDFFKALPWLRDNQSIDWIRSNCSKYSELIENEEALEAKVEELHLSKGESTGDGASNEAAPKLLPGGKTKKVPKKEIVLERNVRNKKKCVTTVRGLETFGVKLNEAAKKFGKKFACGSSVVKDGAGKEEIDVQGDFSHELAAFIMKTYPDIQEPHFFAAEKGKKSPLF